MDAVKRDKAPVWLSFLFGKNQGIKMKSRLIIGEAMFKKGIKHN
jgi:hypothetical protein